MSSTTTADWTAAADGYALADHVVRSVTSRHRAALAAALLDRYPKPRGDAFVDGFHRRLREFISAATPSTGSPLGRDPRIGGPA